MSSTRAMCNDCRRTFDTDEDGTWSKEEGWVVKRRKGGANAVRQKVFTGEVLCPACGRLRELKVLPGQEHLF